MLICKILMNMTFLRNAIETITVTIRHVYTALKLLMEILRKQNVIGIKIH